MIHRLKKNNYKIRSIGLYIWDLINIYNKKASVREHALRINNKIKENINESTIRKYQRYCLATSETIEKREHISMS